jgi:hypothetical protein
MKPGQQRKRLLKLARRVPVEEVEAFVGGAGGSHPSYFVLREHGYEFLCGWYHNSTTEVSMSDDVFYRACCEYLKSRGLVFDSDKAASEYARQQGVTRPE